MKTAPKQPTDPRARLDAERIRRAEQRRRAAAEYARTKAYQRFTASRGR